MNLSEEDILKIADLAKINVTDENISKYKFELEKIFSLIEKLKEVKINQNEEIHNFAGGNLILRKDEITEKNIEDLVISNAPKAEFNYFAVPRVKE